MKIVSIFFVFIVAEVDSLDLAIFELAVIDSWYSGLLKLDTWFVTVSLKINSFFQPYHAYYNVIEQKFPHGSVNLRSLLAGSREEQASQLSQKSASPATVSGSSSL